MSPTKPPTIHVRLATDNAPAEPEGGEVDMRVFVGTEGQTLQLAGTLRLSREEWRVLGCGLIMAGAMMRGLSVRVDTDDNGVEIPGNIEQRFKR